MERFSALQETCQRRVVIAVVQHYLRAGKKGGGPKAAASSPPVFHVNRSVSLSGLDDQGIVTGRRTGFSSRRPLRRQDIGGPGDAYGSRWRGHAHRPRHSGRNQHTHNQHL
jgi:hypothetical protein